MYKKKSGKWQFQKQAPALPGPSYEAFEDRFLKQPFNPKGPSPQDDWIGNLLEKPFEPKSKRALFKRPPIVPYSGPLAAGKLAYNWLGPGKVLNMLSSGFQVLDYLNPAKYTGPKAYVLPWAYTYHWGMYDCGVTTKFLGRTDGGALDEFVFACLAGQIPQFGNIGVGGGTDIGNLGGTITLPVGTDMRSSLTIGRWNGQNPPVRMTLVEHWYYPFTSPGVLGQPVPIPLVPTYGQPTPTLRPPTPAGDIETGYGPGPKPVGGPKPLPDNRRTLRPDVGPEPDPVTRAPPHGPPLPPYIEPETGHPNLPDKKGRKKFKIKYGKAGKLYGFLTEIGDALDCVEKHFNAPTGPKLAGGMAGRALRLADAIYHNPNALDVPNFLACMIEQQLQDKLIGKASGLANQITKSPYWVRPVGVDAGHWAVRMK